MIASAARYAAVVAAAVASVGIGAASILPVGSFHGAGPIVRAVGVVVGAAAGVLAWRGAVARLPWATALVAALATTSVAAALPLQLDQAGRLLATYSSMPAARAAASGGYQVPSAPEEAAAGAFDALRRSMPAHARYVLYSDQGYALWIHAWLLPRLAVVQARDAEWAIFQGKPRKTHDGRLRSLHRLGPMTWLARIAR